MVLPMTSGHALTRFVLDHSCTDTWHVSHTPPCVVSKSSRMRGYRYENGTLDHIEHIFNITLSRLLR